MLQIKCGSKDKKWVSVGILMKIKPMSVTRKDVFEHLVKMRVLSVRRLLLLRPTVNEVQETHVYFFGG